MTQKKRIAALALCALSIAPLSALANPIPLNGSFSFNGDAVTQFTSGGTTYIAGNLGAGINTATSVTVQNPITITATPANTFGAPNDLNGQLPAGSTGYIVNPTSGGTYTLQIPQNNASNPFSTGILPFASTTSSVNGDTFNFYATSDQVLSSVSLGNISELGIIILGTVSDTQNKYTSSLASVGLTFIDNAGALGYTGAFSAPPATTTNVPEPGSLLLVGIGALGLGLCARKFKLTGRVSSGLQDSIA
ncbi:MAG: PEP-CTERM sorting domain-containing protein [Ferrovum sp.]|jgi:hypothetical protein|nr:PEP-CTERM sorting domain-containing protein [Ferrovum sp.]